MTEFFNDEKKHHEHRDHQKKIENEYVYDKAGRLIHVHGERRNSNYVYDENSNRIHGHAGDHEFNAIYDNQDRLIRLNNTIYSYNANGDLLSKSERVKNKYENVSYVYDVFGNLKQAGNVSYKTDLLNRRNERLVNGVVTHKYAYNPEGQLIAELDRNGNLKKTFIYGSKSHVPDYFVDENDNEFKIIVDQLGSVRLIVNALTGEVVQRMNHDEFGKVLIDGSSSLVPFGFAGGLFDSATKLVRFGVRDYDPEFGRWTSKDPIRFSAKDTNLYGYVLQDPINKIDSNGLYAALPGEGGNGGYYDVGGTFGFGFVGTGGVQSGSGVTCIYAGVGVGTTGVYGSFSPSEAPTPGPSSSASAGACGVGGSVSAGRDSGIGYSVGFSTPGVSLVVTGTLICF